MAALMMINVGVVILNTLLLATLLTMYTRILREAPTRFTGGLLLFAGVLLLQNAIQLYFFAAMTDYYAGGVEGLVLVQNLLGTLAVAFLTYVTFRPVGASRTTTPSLLMWEESGKTK